MSAPWVHYLALGLLVWAGLVVLILTWLSGSHERRTAKRDAELTDCHCRLVDSPHDWAQHDDWVSDELAEQVRQFRQRCDPREDQVGVTAAEMCGFGRHVGINRERT